MKNPPLTFFFHLVMSVLFFNPLYSCTSGSTSSQKDIVYQEFHSVDALQEDFSQFRQCLEDSHPCMYRFTSKQEFDSLFEVQYSRIEDSMTTREFYNVLISLVASVGCGHTSLWSPDGYWDQAPERMFPLGVLARDGELYVIPLSDLNFRLMDAGTALLTIRTFAYYEDNEGFNRFIDSSFQVIRDKNILNLILDLRGNEGGDPFCSSHLLGYLQKEPVVYFRQAYGRLNGPLPMAENHFTGKQYYLIDGMCFSTTGHLASLLKYHQLGTFIGEETGATYTCNDASHDIRLKHTGYRLQSASRSFATAVYGLPYNQGILPDYSVRPTIDEVISNQDAVLQYTLKLINQ